MDGKNLDNLEANLIEKHGMDCREWGIDPETEGSLTLSAAKAIKALRERVRQLTESGDDLCACVEIARATIRHQGEALDISRKPQKLDLSAIAAGVCHDDQLVIWAEEATWALQSFLKDPESWEDKVDLENALKREIARIVKTAFELAAQRTPETCEKSERPDGAENTKGQSLG
jgi:hypothetical protein